MNVKKKEINKMSNNYLTMLRESRGLSKAKLAKFIGVSPAAISSYERGERIPRDEIKVRIAEYFGVSIIDVFYYTQKRGS